jgi:hypothetical protein
MLQSASDPCSAANLTPRKLDKPYDHLTREQAEPNDHLTRELAGARDSLTQEEVETLQKLEGVLFGALSEPKEFPLYSVLNTLLGTYERLFARPLHSRDTSRRAHQGPSVLGGTQTPTGNPR